MHVNTVISADAAAERLGVDTKQLLKWAREGRVTSVRYTSRTIGFRPKDLDDFVCKHTKEAWL